MYSFASQIVTFDLNYFYETLDIDWSHLANTLGFLSAADN